MTNELVDFIVDLLPSETEQLVRHIRFAVDHDRPVPGYLYDLMLAHMRAQDIADYEQDLRDRYEVPHERPTEGDV